MKYCQHCGASINDNAEICTKCGCRVKNSIEENLKGSFALGFLASLFFGIIGLLIGAIGGNKTAKGAVIGFIVSIIISIISVILLFIFMEPIFEDFLEPMIEEFFEPMIEEYFGATTGACCPSLITDSILA